MTDITRYDLMRAGATANNLSRDRDDLHRSIGAIGRSLADERLMLEQEIDNARAAKAELEIARTMLADERRGTANLETALGTKVHELTEANHRALTLQGQVDDLSKELEALKVELEATKAKLKARKARR